MQAAKSECLKAIRDVCSGEQHSYWATGKKLPAYELCIKIQFPETFCWWEDLLPKTNQVKLFIGLLLFNCHWHRGETLAPLEFIWPRSHASGSLYELGRIPIPLRANEFNNIPIPNIIFRDLSAEVVLLLVKPALCSAIWALWHVHCIYFTKHQNKGRWKRKGEGRGWVRGVTQFQETSATGHCSVWIELVISSLGPLVPAWFLIITRAGHTKVTDLLFMTLAGL